MATGVVMRSLHLHSPRPQLRKHKTVYDVPIPRRRSQCTKGFPDLKSLETTQELLGLPGGLWQMEPRMTSELAIVSAGVQGLALKEPPPWKWQPPGIADGR